MIDLKKIDNVVVAGIDTNDYPDFCDAYIERADYDGREMTGAEIEELNQNCEFVYDCVINHIF